MNTFKNQLTAAVSIPSELSRFLKLANRGELEVEIKGLEKGLERLYYLGQSFLYAGLTVIAGYLLLSFHEIDELWRWANWAGFIGFGSLFFRVVFRS